MLSEWSFSSMTPHRRIVDRLRTGKCLSLQDMNMLNFDVGAWSVPCLPLKISRLSIIREVLDNKERTPKFGGSWTTFSAWRLFVKLFLLKARLRWTQATVFGQDKKRRSSCRPSFVQWIPGRKTSLPMPLIFPMFLLTCIDIFRTRYYSETADGFLEACIAEVKFVACGVRMMLSCKAIRLIIMFET